MSKSVSRFRVKEGKARLVMKTKNNQVIDFELNKTETKELHEALGKSLLEFDN